MIGLMSVKKFSADWPLDLSVKACSKGQIFLRKIIPPISIIFFLAFSLFHYSTYAMRPFIAVLLKFKVWCCYVLAPSFRLSTMIFLGLCCVTWKHIQLVGSFCHSDSRDLIGGHIKFTQHLINQQHVAVNCFDIKTKTIQNIFDLSNLSDLTGQSA